MSKETKAKVGKLQIAILIRVLVPMLLMGVLISLVANSGYNKAIRAEVGENLRTVAYFVVDAYEETYPGEYCLVGEELISLYKGDTDITCDYEIIDEMKEKTGMEISLIHGNTRILTTLKDQEGNRHISTGINAAIYRDMEEEPRVLYYDLDMDGKMYYACYVPLYNADGSLAGILAVAQSSEGIAKKAGAYAGPILAAIALSLVITGLFAMGYTKEMVGAIRYIQDFLSGMKSGALNNVMSKDVLRRGDEIGAAGKAIVDMQSAMKILVERDALTALYNRRCGALKLRNIQKLSDKQGVPFSVALGDIDYFKKVNDTYGHDAGDVVLKKMAEIMKRRMLGKGFVARWGGEEFLLVFDNATEEYAAKRLGEILAEIRETTLDYEEQKIKVTMTFGVINGSTEVDYGELIRKADENLYFGKSQGRNRIIREQTGESGENLEASVDLDYQEDAEEAAGKSSVIMGFDIANNEIVEKMVQRMSENMLENISAERKKDEP